MKHRHTHPYTPMLASPIPTPPPVASPIPRRVTSGQPLPMHTRTKAPRLPHTAFNTSDKSAFVNPACPTSNRGNTRTYLNTGARQKKPRPRCTHCVRIFVHPFFTLHLILLLTVYSCYNPIGTNQPQRCLPGEKPDSRSTSTCKSLLRPPETLSSQSCKQTRSLQGANLRQR